MAALAVHLGAFGDLGRIRRAAGGEPPCQPRVGYRAEVVDVRHEQVAEALVQQSGDQAAGIQRGVEVAVAGWAPFEVGIGRPAGGHPGVGQQFGFAALDEFQRQRADREVGVGLERRQ